MTIELNHGFLVQTDAKELLAINRFSPFLEVAVAMAVIPEALQIVMSFQHDKMASFMPTLTRSNPSMFVRSFGAFNYSVKGAMPKLLVTPRLDSSGEALFQRRFAIDYDHILKIFPSQP